MALVVTATVLATRPDPEPVRVVRDFFAAITDQDPVRALAIAGVSDPPTGEEARFLRPEAISDQWEARDVRYIRRDTESDTAMVSVTLARPDGTERIAIIKTRQDGDGQWKILEPFARASFSLSPLWYIDINGVQGPAPYDVRGVDYWLLPGFYDYYPQLPPGVEAEFTEASLLVPTLHVHVVALSVGLDASGQDTIARAVEAYIDECAQTSSLTPYACPFGSATSSRVGGYEIFWNTDEEAQWTVREYPVVIAEPDWDSFVISHFGLGAVDLRGTVEWVSDGPRSVGAAEPPGEGTVASVTCEIDINDFEAGFTATGEVMITINPLFADPDASSFLTDTCRDVTMSAP